MTHDIHHEHLMKELSAEFKPMFDRSPHAIYLYLDDTHKICNKKFSQMLGYKSPNEWVKNEYPISDVVERDQKKGIKAYMDAAERFKVTTFTGTWTKKNGKKIKTSITMTPFTYKGEVFVLHFISPVK